MMEHILKIDSEVFETVVAGEKTYEIKYNDRDFKVGDTLLLCETLYNSDEMRQGKPLKYSGRKHKGTISHVLTGPQYGLKDGWAILSLSNFKYAELGRLFVKKVDKQHICKGKFNKWSCTAKCFMSDVCQLRAELLKVEVDKNA